MTVFFCKEVILDRWKIVGEIETREEWDYALNKDSLNIHTYTLTTQEKE